MDALIKYRRKIEKIDKRSARLFEKRMRAVKAVSEIKAARGVPVEDKKRETALEEKNCAVIKNKRLLPYYKRLFGFGLRLSKEYQLENGDDNNGHNQYDPTIFPIISCFWHVKKHKGDNIEQAAPVLQIAYSGNFFMTKVRWEYGQWQP